MDFKYLNDEDKKRFFPVSHSDGIISGKHPDKTITEEFDYYAKKEDLDRHAFGAESGSWNLWDEKWELVDNINDATGQKVSGNTRIASKNYIPVSPNTAYYFATSAANMYSYEYDANHSFLRRTQYDGTNQNVANKSAVTGDNTKYLLFKFVASYGLVYLNDTAIIKGTSGQYEPYIASNAQLTESANASEVRDAELQALGWCVPSEMPIKNSLSNGVLTQYVGRVDLGSLDCRYNGSVWVVYSSNQIGLTPPPNNKTVANIYTSKYKATANDSSFTAMCICVGVFSSGYTIYIDNGSTTEKPSGYMYYELATPIQHNITDMPSQKSMISDEWDSNKTYAVGDYCIYQNALYKCLIQHSGQNPSTSTTYWKIVKVTDIVGSGGGMETFAPTTDWVLVMDRAGQSYVTPNNGWIRAFLGTSNATPSTSLTVNGNVAIQASYYFGVNATGLVRVAKGDVITVTGGSNNVLFCEQPTVN